MTLKLNPLDPAKYLDSDEAIAEYLTAILEDDDPALLAAALCDIARARGMTEIARASGITREALYKALRADAQPRFETVAKVCRALGVRLVAQPVGPWTRGGRGSRRGCDGSHGDAFVLDRIWASKCS